MAGTFVVVTGKEKAAADVLAVGIKLTAAMQQILTVGALPVMNDAKVRAPKLTGNLSRSIHIEPLGPTEVSVGTDVVYAAAQEFGRPDINLPAQPYLRPALDTQTAAAVLAMNRAVAVLVGGV